MPLTELDIPFALNTSKNDLIEQFFVPLLQNSVRYDRGVGFFSSNWVKEAFIGMSTFAMNGGKARWITSPILSKEDWDAILLGNEAIQDEALKNSLLDAINGLKLTLKNETLIALAWMISDGIIEFKLAKPRNKLDHEYHAKMGIFGDSVGNRISFDGSYNDSETGLHNYESIKVFRSWDTTKNYVVQEEEWFEKIWNNGDPNIEVYNIPDAVKARILEIRENKERPYPTPEWVKLQSVIQHHDIDKIPFPNIPETISLRIYQNEAIDKWFNNGNNGIFEMATGTGKTITALAAAVKLLEARGRLLLVVICPYIHLTQQWKTVAEQFGFRPLIVAEAQDTWLESVSNLLRDFQAGRRTQAAIISTNTSFLSDSLRQILEDRSAWSDMLLIADEMHHCGSVEMLKVLPNATPFRLGLSATPIRNYDEFGSSQLLKYFGDIVFEFDLKKAIEEGFLTPYDYHPLPVFMSEPEFAEFVSITRRLNRLHPRPEEPMTERALLLLIKRARVLNNSSAKADWLRRTIPIGDSIRYTLFYAGEQVFNEILRVLGSEKQLIVHEFTYRQNLSARQGLLEQFGNGAIQALVAMKCLDEGVDVPPTRTAYFLASSSIPREFVQRRGRILRTYPGKTSATIWDLISFPPEAYITRGKSDENYAVVRTAIRREYKRVREFASLAQNKHQALASFVDIADAFDLLDI